MRNKIIFVAVCLVCFLFDLFGSIVKVFGVGFSIFSDGAECPIFLIIFVTLISIALMGLAVYYFLRKADSALLGCIISSAVLFILKIICFAAIKGDEGCCSVSFGFIFSQILNLATAAFAIYLHPLLREKAKSIINRSSES